MCNVSGFLPRDPYPLKHQKLSKKKRALSKANIAYMKPRAAKKAVTLMAQASELQYMLYECSKCKVIVHAKCCGGSFPTLHYPKIDKRFEAKMRQQQGLKDDHWYSWYVSMFRSIEWMCDYCCEEEEKFNEHQKCEICRVTSGTSEILKALKPEGQSAQNKVINLTKETTYVHLFCAFWFAEVEAEDIDNLDAIVGIDEIRDNLADKECGLCKAKNGKKLKCSDRNCQEVFHPICGKIRGNQFF